MRSSFLCKASEIAAMMSKVYAVLANEVVWHSVSRGSAISERQLSPQIDLPDASRPSYGIVRCVNYTAHLGRWAIPVTRDDLDSEKVCGIDGCF